MLASRPVVASGARHIAPGTLVLEMHLQTAPGHRLVAVPDIRAHNDQLVQDASHEDAARLDVPLADQLLVRGTRLLHPEVRLEADEAVGVPARRVDGVHERLEADAAEELVLRVVWVIVEVVLAQLVALSAAIADDDVAHALDLEAVGLLEAASPPRFLSLLDHRHDSDFEA